jgi:hypothetical protein
LWLATADMSDRESPTETQIVDASIEATFADPVQRASAKAMWRTHSGDAHGLPWPIFTRASTTTVSAGRVAGTPNPMAEYSSGGDIWEIGESYMACFRLLRRGWRLFDQRSEAP